MKVSELLAVKIENTILKIQQLQAAADKIQADQKALVEAARAEVGASASAIYDPATTEFREP